VPKLFMLIGISGSGKSTWAAQHKNEPGMFTEIYSSDEYRERLFGNMNDQTHNNKVFSQLHKDMLEALAAGKDICYDATNLKVKDRTSFLKLLKPDVEKVAVVFNVNYKIITEQNQSRSRVVPEYVLERQLSRFDINSIKPTDFDNIIVINR